MQTVVKQNYVMLIDFSGAYSSVDCSNAVVSNLAYVKFMKLRYSVSSYHFHHTHYILWFTM